MINTLIVIILVLAVLHFVYEGIIAPTIRQHIKYRLFALRDELRNILIEEESSCDNDIYSYIQSTLNIIIKYSTQFDAFDVYKSVKAMESNPALENMAKERLDSITSAEPSRMSDIHDQAIRLSLWMMLVNMGGLTVYATPIMILLSFFIAVSIRFKTFILNSRMKATTIVSVPESEIVKIIPERLILAAS